MSFRVRCHGTREIPGLACFSFSYRTPRDIESTLTPSSQSEAPENDNLIKWFMEIFSTIWGAIRGSWPPLSKGDTSVGPITCSIIVILATIVLVGLKARRLWGSGTSIMEGLSRRAFIPIENRRPGSWTPVQFTYPPIVPHSSRVADIQPIPYRPFRWGKYHVTMGIRPMAWDEWIELDNQFETYHRIRAHRIKTRGSGAICVLPDNPGVVGSGAAAAIEVVHELAEYLSRRYPTTFMVSRYPDSSPDVAGSKYGWEGAQPIKTITIIPLGVSYDVPLSVGEPDSAKRALEVAALIIQEDLALMIEGSDGRYYFQAGAICIPGFWRMQDKIGLPLDEIHITGDVPNYKEKLDLSMGRFFQRLKVEKPVARNNYSLQVVEVGETQKRAVNTNSDHICNSGMDGEIGLEELAWSTSANGPEDSFSHGGHRVRAPQNVLPPSPLIKNIRLRSERQTLRRLPQSGAIVFTIRTYVTPIQHLGQEPGVPGRLASALRGWGRDVGIYKGKERGNWWDVVIQYLDRCWNEQLKRGISLEGAGKENYPL